MIPRAYLSSVRISLPSINSTEDNNRVKEVQRVSYALCEALYQKQPISRTKQSYMKHNIPLAKQFIKDIIDSTKIENNNQNESFYDMLLKVCKEQILASDDKKNIFTKSMKKKCILAIHTQAKNPETHSMALNVEDDSLSAKLLESDSITEQRIIGNKNSATSTNVVIENDVLEKDTYASLDQKSMQADDAIDHVDSNNQNIDDNRYDASSVATIKTKMGTISTASLNNNSILKKDDFELDGIHDIMFIDDEVFENEDVQSDKNAISSNSHMPVSLQPNKMNHDYENLHKGDNMDVSVLLSQLSNDDLITKSESKIIYADIDQSNNFNSFEARRSIPTVTEHTDYSQIDWIKTNALNEMRKANDLKHQETEYENISVVTEHMKQKGKAQKLQIDIHRDVPPPLPDLRPNSPMLSPHPLLHKMRNKKSLSESDKYNSDSNSQLFSEEGKKDSSNIASGGQFSMQRRVGQLKQSGRFPFSRKRYDSVKEESSGKY